MFKIKPINLHRISICDYKEKLENLKQQFPQGKLPSSVQSYKLDIQNLIIDFDQIEK